ncbi:MAG: glycosyltransferase [Myxococcales bacterium]|nr:glycosyltransferase [Myxococcales bacterium]
MSAQIAYFVHGRGRGHASRALTIGAHLVELGHALRIYAGGDALDLLRGQAALGELVEVAPVLPGPSAILTMARRVRADRRELGRRRPDLVISDGDAPSVRVARGLEIPTLSLGHDQVFLRCHLPQGLPRARVAYERVVAGLTSAGADAAVAVHFLPISAAAPRTWVARPDLAPTLAGEVRDDGSIVAYLRDGEGGEALQAALAAGRRVIAFGEVRGAPAGVERRPFAREAFHAALRGCAAVIATAGSNLLAECVLLGKPILALWRAGDHEQRLNGLMIAGAGVGAAAPIDGALAREVDEFLRRVAGAGFARVDLERALPPASRAVAEAASLLLHARPRARA